MYAHIESKTICNLCHEEPIYQHGLCKECDNTYEPPEVTYDDALSYKCSTQEQIRESLELKR